MQKMKGQIKKNSNGWLTVNSLSGLSTRIKIDFIRQIEIEDDIIRIQIEKDWIVIRRYNQGTIETYLRTTEIIYSNRRWMRDDYENCDDWGKERANRVSQDQKNERYYLEHLDKNFGGKDWEDVYRNVISIEIYWLKDKDFDSLKQQLESLSDNFALNVNEN